MPTVEFDYKDFITLMGEKFSPEELRSEIPMLGVDLESVDEEKIAVEVFPNRPDLLTIEGFTRALKGKLGLETGLCMPEIEDSGITLEVDSSVSNVRPYIACAVVKGMVFDDLRLKALMDAQEKLHVTHGRKRKRVAIGVHDLSKVEAPFTYKAVKPKEISFVPLDMSSPMDLSEILEKHPKGVGYAKILSGKDRYPIIVDKNNEVLSFPPIINGELTRVTEDSTDLFLDVTGTDEKAVSAALNILSMAFWDRGCRIYAVDVKTASTKG